MFLTILFLVSRTMQCIMAIFQTMAEI